jgi:XTP/dITP diphosphohydrolase
MDRINLVMATKSIHKVKEIREMLDPSFSLITMEEAGFNDDIEENGQTLEENAWIKTDTLYQLLQTNIFGEDTGLEIDFLKGLPGVNTARFAGDHRSDFDNIKKVLDLLEGQSNRSAQFRTIIALIFNNEKYTFEGIVKGKIAEEIRGYNGFGYDPIFIPDGYEESFAELPSSVKNAISHRGIAVHKMIAFLC